MKGSRLTNIVFSSTFFIFSTYLIWDFQFIIRVTKLYYISISYYVRHLLIQYILNVALIFCFDTFLILFEQITITFRKLTFSFLENVRFDWIYYIYKDAFHHVKILSFSIL